MVAPAVLASAGLGMLAGAALGRKRADGVPSAPAPQWDARQHCTSCCGTGRENCLCYRWSDGDVGCRRCGGSGRTACRGCGGSGTGRRQPLRLAVTLPRQDVGVTAHYMSRD